MKRIAGTIERDARDYVWQVYVPCPNTFEIDRCRTSDFGIHKPGCGGTDCGMSFDLAMIQLEDYLAGKTTKKEIMEYIN